MRIFESRHRLHTIGATDCMWRNRVIPQLFPRVPVVLVGLLVAPLMVTRRIALLHESGVRAH
jgi:hypothetical protein